MFSAIISHVIDPAHSLKNVKIRTPGSVNINICVNKTKLIGCAFFPLKGHVTLDVKYNRTKKIIIIVYSIISPLVHWHRAW